MPEWFGLVRHTRCSSLELNIKQAHVCPLLLQAQARGLNARAGIGRKGKAPQVSAIFTPKPAANEAGRLRRYIMIDFKAKL